MATDSRGFLRRQAAKQRKRARSICAHLRNLRNLWFFLAEAEQLPVFFAVELA